MVDKDKILKTLRHFFAYKGDVDIDDEGLVNITGTASLVNTYQPKKLPVKFGTVTELFKISDLGLQTLEGCPHTVNHFDCSHNNLTSLEHGPVTVLGSYQCANNDPSSLRGAPQTVPNLFYCHNNPLQDLDGLPQNGSANRLQLHMAYNLSLPLLRLCLVENKHVQFFGGPPLTYARKVKLEEIFNSEEAQGPGGVLRVASILNELSQDPQKVYTFEGNAEL